MNLCVVLKVRCAGEESNVGQLPGQLYQPGGLEALEAPQPQGLPSLVEVGLPDTQLPQPLEVQFEVHILCRLLKIFPSVIKPQLPSGVNCLIPYPLLAVTPSPFLFWYFLHLPNKLLALEFFPQGRFLGKPKPRQMLIFILTSSQWVILYASGCGTSFWRPLLFSLIIISSSSPFSHNPQAAPPSTEKCPLMLT